MGFESLEYPGFLIADPELEDPNFRMTVVALIHHDDQGSFGLVLNRPGEMFLADILPEFEKSPNGRQQVYLGGPVEQNRLFALHNGDSIFPRSGYCSELCPNLFFEPDFSTLENVLYSKSLTHLRFYLGYAGWDKGQLEQEMIQRTWIPSAIHADVAMEDSGIKTWHLALARMGPYYALIGQTGFRPSLN
ncbi:MAG: YqgE/AlgH family protein [Spirochaetales bacterium]|nr:YqgE/AlgH family protein [Spirochaetales bacterium]